MPGLGRVLAMVVVTGVVVAVSARADEMDGWCPSSEFLRQRAG